MDPVDLFRRDGVTAYSHDVQVDDAGIAWVSGDGGTRGYWTNGVHHDPLQGRNREATPLDPIPYAGGGLPQSVTADTTGGFEHNAWRPVGASAPQGDPRYAAGELLLATEEDFGPATEAYSKRGQFTIASLEGSLDGEAWRSTPSDPFRLTPVGTWNPYLKEGSRPVGGPYHPLANFCSAHYFDVAGSTVSYAWYGEGTRFLDISDPENPTQFAYWRPDDGIVWASYMHKGYVYTADRTRRRGRPQAHPQRERREKRRAGGRRPAAIRAPAALPGAGGRTLQGGPRHLRALSASGPVAIARGKGCAGAAGHPPQRADRTRLPRSARRARWEGTSA
jgi:hypothetical protein